ncbi:MAG: DUF58 domain-containing protein [Nitrospinaceae bacterium]|nr:DUF58 domain-containing protein [Nitrospinaceae bacterium]NIU46130.1 DUF58 domain-containing protein [Nitrospinaceae bacterium]NIU98308.1 DUF58 domain-containing protein [Nitrospinaceae bacterium]NIW60872.1 DUF58 domain-containing protein [Nitrospinaceae bacterium]
MENPTATPQAGLTFIEKFKDTRPAFETFIAIKPPPSAGNSRINRIMEQDKARIRSFKRKPVDRKDHVLPTLPAGKKTEVALSFTPLERGYLRLKGLTFHCADPLGLYRAAVNLPAEESLLVLPRMYPTRLLQLADSRKYNQRGVSLASHIGESEEFVGLRDYRPGDPLRHIHWHSWAKTGNPMVKQYQDEYFSRHALILDTFTLYDSEVFEEAVSVAASFSANIDLADSLLDLMFVGTESYCFTAGRSLSHTDQILEILATVKKCTDHPFRVLKDLVLSRSSLLSGSICVFLDWDEERQSLVSRLRAQNIPLLVIVVREPGAAGDLDPGPMKDQADRFHVLEAGQIEEGLRRV